MKKEEQIELAVKAMSNFKNVVEKSSMDYKSHFQLQQDLNLITGLLNELFQLKYPAPAPELKPELVPDSEAQK